MEIVVKTVKIRSWLTASPVQGSMYEIVHLQDKATYKAALWGYNKEDGYLAQFSLQESSPEFATAAEAEAFAQREWVN